MHQIWFTSDLHLGHANIIRHCSRPFSTAEEMDEALISAINSAANPGDTLWILGDFSYRGKSPAFYRDQIRCRDVRLLIGNHDKRPKCEAAGFQYVGDVAEISIGTQRIWMSHYPHRSWPASHKGSWHLYGHTHGALDGEDRQRGVNALDVGVDSRSEWFPWSLDELKSVLPRAKPC